MLHQPLLFVSWAANLGGVPSVLYTRMKGLRELDIPSESFFYRTGAGITTFADFPAYVEREPKKFLSHFRSSHYASVSLINFTDFLSVIRQTRFKGRIIYEIHGFTEKGLQQSSALSAAEVTAIVVPSQYVADLVRPVLGSMSPPIRVIPNGVDVNLFHPIEQSIEPLVAHDGHDKRIVLWVGRLDSNKNWPELLEIASLICKRNTNILFWVVGDTNVTTSDVQSFEGEVERRGLRSFVRLHQCVSHSQMPKIYNIAAHSGGCLLSTSKSEGHQLSPLEAMACGCPVVCSAVGGNVETISHEQNGKLYPLGHPELAVACMEDLMENRSSRARIIETALISVAERYNQRHHARQYLQVVGLKTPGNGEG